MLKALASILLLAGSIAAQSSIKVTAPTMQVNGTFDVPIEVETNASIDSFQFTLKYNPGVILPTGPNFGCSLGRLTAQLHIECGELERGSLRVVVFGEKPFTGSGSIVHIQFQSVPKAKKNISPLMLDGMYFFQFNDVVPSTASHGVIIIAS